MKSSLLWLLSSAIQLYKLYKFMKLTKYYKSLYRKAKDLPVITPNQLYEQVAKKIYNVGDYVICQGWVKGSEICRSRLSPKLKIIYS